MEGAGRTAVLRWVAAVRASPAVGTADLRRAQPADALERVAALRAAGVANRRHLNAAMDRLARSAVHWPEALALLHAQPPDVVASSSGVAHEHGAFAV